MAVWDINHKRQIGESKHYLRVVSTGSTGFSGVQNVLGCSINIDGNYNLLFDRGVLPNCILASYSFVDFDRWVLPTSLDVPALSLEDFVRRVLPDLLDASYVHDLDSGVLPKCLDEFHAEDIDSGVWPTCNDFLAGHVENFDSGVLPIQLEVPTVSLVDYVRSVLPLQLDDPLLSFGDFDRRVLPKCAGTLHAVLDVFYDNKVLPDGCTFAPTFADLSMAMPIIEMDSDAVPTCRDFSYDDLIALKTHGLAKCTYFINMEVGRVNGDGHLREYIEDLKHELRGGGKSKDRKKLKSLRKANEETQAEEYQLTEGSEVDTSLLEPSWIYDEERHEETLEATPEPAGMFQFCSHSNCSEARGEEQKYLIMCSACEFSFWFDHRHWDDLNIQEEEFVCSMIGRSCQNWETEVHPLFKNSMTMDMEVMTFWRGLLTMTRSASSSRRPVLSFPAVSLRERVTASSTCMMKWSYRSRKLMPFSDRQKKTTFWRRVTLRSTRIPSTWIVGTKKIGMEQQMMTFWMRMKVSQRKIRIPWINMIMGIKRAVMEQMLNQLLKGLADAGAFRFTRSPGLSR